MKQAKDLAPESNNDVEAESREIPIVRQVTPPKTADRYEWAMWHAELARRAVVPPGNDSTGWLPDYERAANHCELAKRFDAGIGESVEEWIASKRREIVRILAGLSDDEPAREKKSKTQRDMTKRGPVLRQILGSGPRGPMTHAEIGEEIGLAKQRVQQIEVRALAKLEKRLQMRQFQDLAADFYGVSPEGSFEPESYEDLSCRLT